jgi:dihydrofolate reductase
VLGEDLAAEIIRLKQQPGRKIAVLGSSELTASLIEWRLLDELRIMVSPIALGAGRPVLAGLTGRVPMSLLGARAFESGNVLHSYRPDTLGS